MITLNRNNLTEFVEYYISDEVSQSKKQYCWTFSASSYPTFAQQDFTRCNELLFKKFKQNYLFQPGRAHTENQEELQSEACNWSEIGFYQRHNFDFGLVTQINENNKLAIDYVTGQDPNKMSSSWANYANSSHRWTRSLFFGDHEDQDQFIQ